TVPILMLQSLAVERCAAGRSSDEKAFGPHILSGPNQIADPLEAEHRVVNVKWNHVDSVRAVGGPGRTEARHRAGLGDAFLQNLTVDRLLVLGNLLRIDRLIKLTDVRIDADLVEHAFHAEGAR